MSQEIGLRGPSENMPSYASGDRSLIIGDGVIGKALAEKIQLLNEPFILTSRKQNTAPAVDFLNLEDVSDYSIPEGVKTAYICAGISTKSACEENFPKCRKINVTNTVKLIKSLIIENIFVVFLSSVEVFSGNESKYDVNDTTCSISTYGKLKVETENELIKLGGNYAIIRLTKVLNNESSIAEKWTSQLKKGDNITPFNDIYISPISLAYATEFILSVGKHQEAGIFHLSGNDDYSYYEIATMLANKIGSSDDLVSGIAPHVKMPTYASLSMKNNTNINDFKPQTIKSVLEDLFSE